MKPWLIHNKPHTKEAKLKISLATKGIPKPTPTNKFPFGELHPNWKGGITPIHLQIRHSLEYKKWRKTIFERDNYICQICSQRGGDLQVDHWPKPFSQLLQENNIQSLEDAINCKEFWDIKNNRTLCINCHKKTNTYLKNFGKHIWQHN